MFLTELNALQTKYEAIITFLVAVTSKPWQHPTKGVRIMVPV